MVVIEFLMVKPKKLKNLCSFYSILRFLFNTYYISFQIKYVSAFFIIKTCNNCKTTLRECHLIFLFCYIITKKNYFNYFGT